MTLRPRILTERLARVFRSLYPLPGMAHGSKLLHQHTNVRATVSLPQIQYSLKNIKPLLMVILRLQKQSVFKQKTLCFLNSGFFSFVKWLIGGVGGGWGVPPDPGDQRVRTKKFWGPNPYGSGAVWGIVIYSPKNWEYIMN